MTPNFYKFYSNPWGPLEESYFTCTQNLQDAIFNAAGIANGTAMLITPILISMAITLLKIIVRQTKARQRGRVVPLVQGLDDFDGEDMLSNKMSPGYQGPNSPSEGGGNGKSVGLSGDLDAAPSRADFMALKAELDELKTKLNRYEGIWGWERPF